MLPGQGYVLRCEPFYDHRILIDPRRYVVKETLNENITAQIGA